MLALVLLICSLIYFMFNCDATPYETYKKELAQLEQEEEIFKAPMITHRTRQSSSMVSWETSSNTSRRERRHSKKTAAI